MAKVVQFPVNPTLEKLGLQRVEKKRPGKEPPKKGQLNLFTSGKVVRLNQLSTFEEALMLDEQNDKATARQLYQRAIIENDSTADAYCNLGILESQEGNYPKGIDCFTLALKADPRHYEAHYNLANLYAEVGNFALAKVHYEISIELAPSFPNSYFNLGLTLAMMKQYQDAVNVLGSYLSLAPEEDQQATRELIFKLSHLL